MDLCVSTIEWRWGNDYQKRLEFLMRYGKNAREVLPQLRKKRPEGAEQAANINKAIAAIEAATDAPKLVTLKEFIANASKSSPKKDNSNQ